LWLSRWVRDVAVVFLAGGTIQSVLLDPALSTRGKSMQEQVCSVGEEREKKTEKRV